MSQPNQDQLKAQFFTARRQLRASYMEKAEKIQRENPIPGKEKSEAEIEAAVRTREAKLTALWQEHDRKLAALHKRFGVQQ